MICSDKDRILDFVYGEGSAGERAEAEAHLAACPTCRAEVADLSDTRARLGAWAPPDVPRITLALPPARWRGAWRPALGYAAAAAVLLCAGAGVLNLEVTRDRDGWRVQTSLLPRRGAPAPVEAGAAADGAMPLAAAKPQRLEAGAAVVTEPALRAAFARFEQRLARERGPAPLAARGGSADLTRAQVTDLVRALVAESEARQHRDTALVVRNLISDLETQRRFDIRQIETNFDALEGRTGAEVAQTHQLVKYLIDSQKK